MFKGTLNPGFIPTTHGVIFNLGFIPIPSYLGVWMDLEKRTNLA